MALTQYRRHAPKCRHHSTPKQQTKKNCNCPIYVKGTLNHVHIRRSMDLTDWGAAQMQIAAWVKAGSINGALAGQNRTLAFAVTEYFDHLSLGEQSPSTKAKNTLLLVDRLIPYCASRHVTQLADVTTGVISAFRLTWKTADPYTPDGAQRTPLGTRSTHHMHHRLNAFFKFCVEQTWITSSPVSALPKMPKYVNQVQPYSPEEINRMLAACDVLPQPRNAHYNRGQRARALIIILRWTGLRFGDAATIKWDNLADGRLEMIAQKNKSRIRQRLADPIKAALFTAAGERNDFSRSDKYVFWTGLSSPAVARFTLGHLLEAVYTLAGIEDGHAHRFRHTFVVEALKCTNPIIPVEDIAQAIGDTVATVQEFYSAYVQDRQVLMEERFAKMPGFSTTPAPLPQPQAFPRLVLPTARASKIG